GGSIAPAHAGAGLRRHDGPGGNRRPLAGTSGQVRRRDHAAAQDLLARARGAAQRPADQGLAPPRTRRRDAQPGRSSQSHGLIMTRLADRVPFVFGAGPNTGGTTALFSAGGGPRVGVPDMDASVAAKPAGYLPRRGFDALPLTGNALVEDDVARMV